MRRVFAKMQPCISVLTHISSDVSQPSLYLTAKNGQKYLIGRIGEGFQRIIGEQGVRTSKLSGVFLTGTHKWESVSGIPGMFLSFADRDLGLSKLYTGPGVTLKRVGEMISSWSNFTFHQPLSVTPDCSIYSDENVEIEPFTTNQDSTSYIVQLKPVRGKFMVEKAKALGVPPGKLFGQLSEGTSVTIPGTSTIVHPDDVLGPTPKPVRVVVLDLPTMEHVRDALKQRELMLKKFTVAPDFELRAIYYFFGKEVDLASEEVRSLLSQLSEQPETKHFISHPLTSPDYNTLHTIAEFQTVFRKEFPDHFSLLYSQPARSSLPSGITGTTTHTTSNVRILEQQHVLTVCPRDTDQKRTKKAKMELEIEPPRHSSQIAVDGLPFVPCSELTEPEVVTLGTGASAPSKYRNVSGTLVRSSFGSFIFDSGEATINTITRIYGPAGRDSLFKELRVLYISHMHADHHLGAQQVLRNWLAVAVKHNLPKLILAAPCQFHAFIKQWAQLDGFEAEFAQHVYPVDLDDVCIGKRYSSTEPIGQQALETMARNCGISILTCTAIHCSYSYNGCITTPPDANGRTFKVSYSGDSRPNRFFAQNVGLNSDLLIHEATHENELAEEAVKKRHSTIGEALEVARIMKARNTILTHISQRYPRLPSLGDEDSSTDQNACFGFDGMHTKLSEIKNIQKMVPKMSELFESLETTAQKSD